VTEITEAQGLENLKKHATFGNAHGVRRMQWPNGTITWTGWVGGALYTSKNGEKWEPVTELWRTT
jgi:hypothetical protein